MQSRETQITMVKWTNAGGQTESELMSDLLFTFHQHGGDDSPFHSPYLTIELTKLFKFSFVYSTFEAH